MGASAQMQAGHLPPHCLALCPPLVLGENGASHPLPGHSLAGGSLAEVAASDVAFLLTCHLRL